MFSVKKRMLLEMAILSCFTIALVFGLPGLASTELEMRNPTIALLPWSVTLFALSRALVVYRDFQKRDTMVLFVTMAVETLGYWLFLVLLVDIMKMNVPSI